jgi:hypothetical protein
MSRFGTGEGISSPILNPAYGAGFALKDYAKDVSLDLVNRIFCNDDLPDAGSALSKAMVDVCVTLLDYPVDSQPSARCYFRLGEALARAVTKISDKKWSYAGYRDNEPNNLEGEAFRAADGEIKKAIGLASRAEGSFLENNPCEVLRLVVAATNEAETLADNLRALSTPDLRRKAFNQYLSRNLGGTNWRVGMEFLPTGPIDGNNGNGGGGGGGSKPPSSPSGSGGIIAVAAAAAAAYFLTKG